MIQIGIMGYGNLGRGVEYAVAQNPDMQLAAVFTRRDPASIQTVTPDVPVLAADKAAEMQDKIDVMILCGGSATKTTTKSSTTMHRAIIFPLPPLPFLP